MSQVRGAIAALAPHLTRPALVIGKSAVPPGTTSNLERELTASAPAGGSVEVAWNPEFCASTRPRPPPPYGADCSSTHVRQ